MRESPHEKTDRRRDAAGGSRFATRIVPWLTLGLAGSFALRRLDDSDTWWHLAAGRWIVENRSIPAVDKLSYTVPDHSWVNLQWLWDVLCYWLYQAGGADALILVAAACYVAATGVLIRNVRGALGPAAATLLVVWALIIFQERFAVRPETISFVFLQVVLWILATAGRTRGRWLWLLVPLMLLWVNMHSLFAVGLYAIVCAAVVTTAVEHIPVPRTWREATALDAPVRRRLLVVTGLCLVATVVNPFHLRGTLFPLGLVSRFDQATVYTAIGEFNAPFDRLFLDATTTAYQLLTVFGILVVALAALLSAYAPRGGGSGNGGGRFDLVGLAVFAGLLGTSLLARRNMALFALGGLPFLAQCLRITLDRWMPSGASSGRALRRVATVGIAAGVVAATWFVAGNGFYRWDRRIHEFGLGVLEVHFPVRASRFIQTTGLPGRLFNDLTTGGYVAWTRPVDGGIFIDGRLEVYDDFFADYRSLLAVPESWPVRAEELGVQTVLLSHHWKNRHALIAWLEQSPDWARVYFDEVALVWVRVRGNEDLIDRARAAFPAAEEGARERLLASSPSRGFPVGRVAALDRYALVLSNLGRADEAATFFEKTLEFDLPTYDERENSLWLADYYRWRGDPENTREYIERAARVDPDHASVREAVKWLEAQ